MCVDIALHTILDAEDEYMDEDVDSASRDESDDRVPCRIVRSGVGDITVQDILVAAAAKGGW